MNCCLLILYCDHDDACMGEEEGNKKKNLIQSEREKISRHMLKFFLKLNLMITSRYS